MKLKILILPLILPIFLFSAYGQPTDNSGSSNPFQPGRHWPDDQNINIGDYFNSTSLGVPSTDQAAVDNALSSAPPLSINVDWSEQGAAQMGGARPSASCAVTTFAYLSYDAGLTETAHYDYTNGVLIPIYAIEVFCSFISSNQINTVTIGYIRQDRRGQLYKTISDATGAKSNAADSGDNDSSPPEFYIPIGSDPPFLTGIDLSAFGLGTVHFLYYVGNPDGSYTGYYTGGVSMTIGPPQPVPDPPPPPPPPPPPQEPDPNDLNKNKGE